MAAATAASDNEYILYDLPSKAPVKAWSMNPWKVRLILNYKNLPYKTEWLEYPDVAPTFKANGLPPNPADQTPYTIPVLSFPPSTPLPSTAPPSSTVVLPSNRTLKADSHPLAVTLETLHPTPSLHLASPKVQKVIEAVTALGAALLPVWMPLIPTQILSEKSAEYFHRTREARFGMSLEEMGRQRGGVDGGVAWKGAEGPMKDLEALFGEGPFALGKDVSYGDLYLVAYLQCFKRADPTGKIFERIVEGAPSLGRVYEACEKWVERDSY